MKFIKTYLCTVFARQFTKEINDSAKGLSEICRPPRHVSQVNSKMVKHDARKTVFIRVGAERDAR